MSDVAEGSERPAWMSDEHIEADMARPWSEWIPSLFRWLRFGIRCWWKERPWM